MRIEWNKQEYPIAGRAKNSRGRSTIALLIIILLTMGWTGSIAAQENVITVGIQYKPIFSSDFTGGGLHTVEEDRLRMSQSLERGSSFGLIIRKGFTKSLSFETGINSVTRIFRVDFSDLDSTFDRTVNFKYLNYEIPLQGLIYIRLGEKSWINTSLGMSINAYPSDVEGFTRDFGVITFRENKFKLALIANIGYEYRTKKSGYWYIGASFYNPLNRIGVTRGIYQSNAGDRSITMDTNGNYLTLDLRYFFHEQPKK